MVFQYDGQVWTISPTKSDHNSIFHSIFGIQKDTNSFHTEDMAHVRRTNFLNFLTFYEDNKRPSALTAALGLLLQQHGWSIENDNDFKKYIKFASEERQVLPEELVILAALENIRIVLFRNEQELPEIVEPVNEIIDNYPFVGSSSIKNAFIALVGETYSKLTPQKTSEDDEKRLKSSNKLYEKFSGTPLAGIWYEINLLNIVMLNALKNCTDWRLSSENVDACYFDDLVLEFGPEKSAFLLQARHQKRKRVVTVRDFFGHKMSSFYLPKYFFSFLKVRNNFNISNVVICTNTKVQLNTIKECVVARNLTEDDFLYFEETSSVCYSFSNEIVPLFLEKFKHHSDECRGDPLLVTEDNIKSFIRHFQIISLYPGPVELEKVIEDKLVHMDIIEKFESTNCARFLNKMVIEWFDNVKGVYMTPLHVQTIFSEARSQQFLGKLHRLGLELKPNKLHINITKKITQIVPKGDQTLSLLKVFKFLEKEESKTLFLSTRESFFIQQMMVEAFEAPRFMNLVIYTTEPVTSPYELCKVVLKNVKKFEYKKVILISDRQDKMAKLLRDLDPSIFDAVYDDVTFTDFTEASQEDLLDKAVLFYEASL